MSIYQNISDFHSQVGKIKKDSINPHFKNKYADINTVLEAIREPLKDAKLAFVQVPKEAGVQTILSTIDGKETIESFVPYIMVKQDMQQLGSAITYARRYALVTMLGLEAEDDDGNLASKPKEQPKVPPSETLNGYLDSKGFSKEAKDGFIQTNKLNAESAKSLLADKAKLDKLIEGYLNPQL